MPASAASELAPAYPVFAFAAHDLLHAGAVADPQPGGWRGAGAVGEHAEDPVAGIDDGGSSAALGVTSRGRRRAAVSGPNLRHVSAQRMSP